MNSIQKKHKIKSRKLLFHAGKLSLHDCSVIQQWRFLMHICQRVPASYMQDASLPTGNYLEFRGVVVIYARREEEEEEEVGITLSCALQTDFSSGGNLDNNLLIVWVDLKLETNITIWSVW